MNHNQKGLTQHQFHRSHKSGMDLPSTSFTHTSEQSQKKVSVTKNGLKNKHFCKTGAGFTLIETLIYIALFALIMGSGVAASFYVIDSAEKEKISVNAIADAQFLLRKIDWALTGSAIVSPSSGASASFLRVNKDDFPSNPILIDLDFTTGRANIATGTNSPIELTGDRVTIANLQFQNIPAILTKPAAIKAAFTANGTDYELTRYLRK